MSLFFGDCGLDVFVCVKLVDHSPAVLLWNAVRNDALLQLVDRGRAFIFDQRRCYFFTVDPKTMSQSSQYPGTRQLPRKQATLCQSGDNHLPQVPFFFFCMESCSVVNGRAGVLLVVLKWSGVLVVRWSDGWSVGAVVQWSSGTVALVSLVVTFLVACVCLCFASLLPLCLPVFVGGVGWLSFAYVFAFCCLVVCVCVLPCCVFPSVPPYVVIVWSLVAPCVGPLLAHLSAFCILFCPELGFPSLCSRLFNFLVCVFWVVAFRFASFVDFVFCLFPQ